MEYLEEALSNTVNLFMLLLEGLSVFCVVLGIVAAAKALPSSFYGLYPLIRIRLAFGKWLALALEFQLGSDILATTISPSYAALGKLGAVAVIRTFLNYFLSVELKEEFELQKESQHEQGNKSENLDHS